MLSLSNIQSTVAAAISGTTFFSASPAVSVIVDDGYKEREMETALRTNGFVVVVSPVLGVKFHDQGIVRTFTGDAHFVVSVMANQQVNPTKANRDVNEAVKAVIAAVLAWTPGNGDRRFQLDQNDTVSISMLAEGLIAYDVAFTKQISIN